MSERRRQDGKDPRPTMLAREAVRLAGEQIAEITGTEPGISTSVLSTDEGGWIIEVEVVEDRRIPSSADMLALYEVELDADGDLLGYRRIQRYMRSQSTSGARGGQA